MSQLPPRRRIRDTELMRALAHPLRTALLGYLMSAGSRTASECATAVDSTASNCSWHLRQLAQWGLVERVEATDGRERPWRATAVGLDYGDFDTDPATRGAQLAATAAQLGEDHLLTQRFLDSVEDIEPAWRDAAALHTSSLRITARELAELNAAIEALVRPYVSTIRTEAPDDARAVHASWRAVPRLDADGRPSA
ncbi:ArsR/SmtB family transcription factor [Qaidamihabitans albus]|uniref:ArsR/SmtB family transcription factor n=1 Tax=Qaidamihabitans albus TaxID=2795733 RepID=UPI0018F1B3A5|nr:helix-turn-helix domain-containing protein [Qaidamihabitans albus]